MSLLQTRQLQRNTKHVRRLIARSIRKQRRKKQKPDFQIKIVASTEEEKAIAQDCAGAVKDTLKNLPIRLQYLLAAHNVSFKVDATKKRVDAAAIWTGVTRQISVFNVMATSDQLSMYIRHEVGHAVDYLARRRPSLRQIVSLGEASLCIAFGYALGSVLVSSVGGIFLASACTPSNYSQLSSYKRAWKSDIKSIFPSGIQLDNMGNLITPCARITFYDLYCTRWYHKREISSKDAAIGESFAVGWERLLSRDPKQHDLAKKWKSTSKHILAIATAFISRPEQKQYPHILAASKNT